MQLSINCGAEFFWLGHLGLTQIIGYLTISTPGHDFSCIEYSYILFNSSWFTTLNTFCYGLRQTSVRSEPWAAISLNSVTDQCNGCRALPTYITYITIHTILPCLSNAMVAKHTLAKHTMLPCLTSAMVAAHYHTHNITLSAMQWLPIIAKHTLAKHTMIPCLTNAMVAAHYHKYNITIYALPYIQYYHVSAVRSHCALVQFIPSAA